MSADVTHARAGLEVKHPEPTYLEPTRRVGRWAIGRAVLEDGPGIFIGIPAAPGAYAMVMTIGCCACDAEIMYATITEDDCDTLRGVGDGIHPIPRPPCGLISVDDRHLLIEDIRRLSGVAETQVWECPCGCTACAIYARSVTGVVWVGFARVFSGFVEGKGYPSFLLGLEHLGEVDELPTATGDPAVPWQLAHGLRGTLFAAFG